MSRPNRLPYRGERGVVFPSPVVILSVVAVAMAGIAFVATQGKPPTEREVTITAAKPPATATATDTATSTPTPSMPTATPKKHQKPALDKGKVYVEVYNNSGISGLAG